MGRRSRASLKFVEEVYHRTVEDYDSRWRLLDDTLYRLCRENHGHSNLEEVCAKLWIIGRTYATGIERQVLSKRTQGSSLSQVADYLHSKAAAVDNILATLKFVSEPLSPSGLRIIVSAHGQLVKLLTQITRKKRPP